MFYLDKLHIKGFRNYHNQQLVFHPRLNLVIGENAQGKTNLLESIYYLSVTRSFRTNRDQELANFEDRFFYIKGQFRKNDFTDLVQISYRLNEQLKISVNYENVNRFDHLQRFPVVVFSPDDLQVIREGPSIRRRFLNLEGSRLNPLYFKDLKDYQRALLQRNYLLKDKRLDRNPGKYLEPWDKAISSLGSSIILARLELVKALEQEAKLFFRKITGTMEELTLSYLSTVKLGDSPAAVEDNFLKALALKRESELKRGSTMIGPHLDDLKVLINGHDSRHYSSQGQKRTAALALKMAEINLFCLQNEASPIILLDDVFSEFDNNRKQHLLNFLQDIGGQCFISSAAGRAELFNILEGESKMFTINGGVVVNETN